MLSDRESVQFTAKQFGGAIDHVETCRVFPTSGSNSVPVSRTISARIMDMASDQWTATFLCVIQYLPPTALCRSDTWQAPKYRPFDLGPSRTRPALRVTRPNYLGTV
jgi:hypothetical protein